MPLLSFLEKRWHAAIGLVVVSTVTTATVLWWQATEGPLTIAETVITTPTKKWKDPLAPTKDHRDPDVDGEPGFYQQWFDMRKDEHGTIPRGLRQQWYQHDRRTLAQHSSARSTNPFASTTFMGPTNVGGRTRALLVDRSNSSRIFAGGISGGLWLSNNGGATWAPINDASATLSVTSLTQSPFNANEIYYSTGESRGNSAGLNGDGIWKSTDGGNTFTQLASTTSNSHLDRVWTIQHGKDLTNPNTVYIGTNSGGVYRTNNGGTTWKQVLNTPSQINDIITFADGGILASAHGSGLYYSPSGDTGTYHQLAHANLPTSGFKRIEIENCATIPNAIYALFENSRGTGISHLLYSSDRGVTWEVRSAPSTGNTYSRYCIMLGVHPSDTNRLVAAAASSRYRYSTNGGRSWSFGPFTHADHHIVAYDIQNSDVFYTGNDGGVFAHTWSSLSSATDLNIGYHTTQFYAGFYGPTGDQAFGGAQDNGTHSVGTPLSVAQFKITGGDGGPTFINLQSPTGAGYQSYQRGSVYRRNNMIRHPSFSNRVHLDTMLDEGVNFIHPYTINRTDGDQVYYPTRRGLWASNDGGLNMRKLAGGSNSQGAPYAVEAAPTANPCVYYGGSSGRLYRVDHAATAPANSGQTLMSLPTSVSSRTISGIHALSDSTIYVCFSSMSSFPHVWKVTGANTMHPIWTDVSGNLPVSLPVNSVAVNPNNTDQIFAGTDFGLYYTTDGGTTWLKNTTLPNVAVFDVHFRASDDKLFIFTHGRGIWLSEVSTVISTRRITTSNEIFSPNTFPNPVRERIHVRNQFGRVEQAHLAIYDLQGRLLVEKANVTLTPRTDGAVGLDVGHLVPTTYALVIRATNGEQQTIKFIKQ